MVLNHGTGVRIPVPVPSFARLNRERASDGKPARLNRERASDGKPARSHTHRRRMSTVARSAKVDRPVLAEEAMADVVVSAPSLAVSLLVILRHIPLTIAILR